MSFDLWLQELQLIKFSAEELEAASEQHARLAAETNPALYRLCIGIADGMPIARVWACRYSK